jgi:hypothetical protein
MLRQHGASQAQNAPPSADIESADSGCGGWHRVHAADRISARGVSMCINSNIAQQNNEGISFS